MCKKSPTLSQHQEDYAFRIPWVSRSSEAGVIVLDEPMFIRRLGCYGVSYGVSIIRDMVIPISTWHLPLGTSRPLWSFAPAVLVIPVALTTMDRKELKPHFPLSLLLSFSSNLPLLLSPMIVGKQTREVTLGRLMGNSFPLSASLSGNMCLYCFSNVFWSWSCHFMSIIPLLDTVFLSSSWIG